jgi:hypothetical protein
MHIQIFVDNSAQNRRIINEDCCPSDVYYFAMAGYKQLRMENGRCWQEPPRWLYGVRSCLCPGDWRFCSGGTEVIQVSNLYSSFTIVAKCSPVVVVLGVWPLQAEAKEKGRRRLFTGKSELHHLHCFPTRKSDYSCCIPFIGSRHLTNLL